LADSRDTFGPTHLLKMGWAVLIAGEGFGYVSSGALSAFSGGYRVTMTRTTTILNTGLAVHSTSNRKQNSPDSYPR